jgi:hypothetical protein
MKVPEWVSPPVPHVKQIGLLVALRVGIGIAQDPALSRQVRHVAVFRHDAFANLLGLAGLVLKQVEARAA